ncbi:hypothetical protein OCC_14265 [Thermococcus litoralis DSM 5473]|uniref:Uncharacterized protein n=1 Tax=Thermococcus litoralis (strain ATCC 51850 / DSM 5473 / JCM 8560 / NS-C) TaxID=523849 RepID=S5ZIJ0_THELN|nr:hypothetical protein OCC_14265 [Thermococcus litoralis DSM 5473]
MFITSAPSRGILISAAKVYKLYQKIFQVLQLCFQIQPVFLLFCVFLNVFNVLT